MDVHERMRVWLAKKFVDQVMYQAIKWLVMTENWRLSNNRDDEV